jgi:hypothetical protein
MAFAMLACDIALLVADTAPYAIESRFGSTDDCFTAAYPEPPRHS